MVTSPTFNLIYEKVLDSQLYNAVTRTMHDGVIRYWKQWQPMHVTEKGDVVIRKLNSKISNDTRVITRERDLCYLGEFTNNFSVIRLHSQSV
jgi:hypothetical protein